MKIQKGFGAGCYYLEPEDLIELFILVKRYRKHSRYTFKLVDPVASWALVFELSVGNHKIE